MIIKYPITHKRVVTLALELSSYNINRLSKLFYWDS